MNASTKTMLMQCFTLLSLTFLPVAFCSLSDSVMHAVILMVVCAIIYISIRLFPLSCSMTLCTGRLHETVTRISFWKESVHFECDTCGDAFDLEVFSPDITIEFST